MTTLTVHGHSAASLVREGRTLFIDPGSLSALDSLGGADAILITHAHWDHAAPEAIAAVAAPVWAPADVVAQLTEAGVAADRLTAVAPGDAFDAAGFSIEVHGGAHAAIIPGVANGSNNVYLVDGELVHTGDELPEIAADAAASVKAVLLPVAGPWMRLSEAIDFARQFPGALLVPVHDAILNEAGQMLSDRIVSGHLPENPYRRLAVGESIEV